MKLALGSDERLPVVDHVRQWLQEHGHEVAWHGPDQGATLPWPQVARQVAEQVAGGRAAEGVLFCWTGTSVSMAANKISGVRAALCADAQTARGARLWNKANVLCLSLRTTTPALAEEILERWFNTSYLPNPNDDACLAQVEELDKIRLQST
ncbi:MAG: RpiB/LacA/LacB family sugar-phosphate isomerase [Anaerolineales bacterium]